MFWHFYWAAEGFEFKETKFINISNLNVAPGSGGEMFSSRVHLTRWMGGLIIGFSVGAFAQGDRLQHFNKDELEGKVLQKFISLQSEKEEFYRIDSTEISETVDNTYGQPGYNIQINYSTPQCPHNYFRGLIYSVVCTEDKCPFGMVYRTCYY